MMQQFLKDFFNLHLLTRIEKIRLGLDINHTSMIHNATTVIDHFETLKVLERYQKELILMINEDEHNKVIKILSYTAKKYYKKYSQLNLMANNLKSLEKFQLKEHLTEIIFVELNRRDEEIDTSEGNFLVESDYLHEIDYPLTGSKSYIVTGGARIARGLTLEGLTVTCFSRRAVEPNYDTMLQMARWCGYRKGYGELVRILTTHQIVEDYHTIFEAEAHMRMQIKLLKDNSDPLKDIIWIKDNDGMNISGRLPTKKFRNVIDNFDGFVAEYTWTQKPPILHNDGSNEKAWKAFFRLYQKINSSSKPFDTPPKKESGYEVSTTQFSTVNKFVNDYCSDYPSSTVCPTKESLLAAVKELSKKYKKCNVAVASPVSGDDFSFMDVDFNLSIRTPENGKIKQVYSSFEKAVEIDLQNGQLRDKPLLLIYLADHNHEYSDGRKCFPGAVKPVPIFGIICPISQGKIEQYMGRFSIDPINRPSWLN